MYPNVYLNASVMRRQFVARMARAPAFGHLLAKLRELLDEPVDLLLLPVDRQVELVEQVVGEARLDLQVLDAAFQCVCVFHAPIGQDDLSHGAAALRAYTRRPCAAGSVSSC